jgi:membrane peptidoglycan carboxypeptidase
MLDRHGRTLATFYDENRVSVPLSDVDPLMRRAILAIEDHRFYDHGALDLTGTLRATPPARRCRAGPRSPSSWSR